MSDWFSRSKNFLLQTKKRPLVQVLGLPLRMLIKRMNTNEENKPMTVSDSKALQVANWVTDSAIDGFGVFSSAADLADTFLNDGSYCDHHHRVSSLIKWESSKNFTSGFVTGLGGLIALPVALPAALGSSWLLQARMSAGIARIYGHDIYDERVRTFVLLSLVGDACKEIVRDVGIQVSGKIALNALKRLPGKLLIEINKRVGFRLLTKAGTKGIVNLIKIVPVLGGCVGGAFDGGTCYCIGKTAKSLFAR